MRIRISTAVLAFVLLPGPRFAAAQAVTAPAVAAPAIAAPVAAPAYEADPKFIDLMKQGHALAAEHRYPFALDAYKKANKIAAGKSLPCLSAMYEAEMDLAEYKDAVATAAQMAAASTLPRDKSFAEGRQGQALLRQAGEKPKPAQLEAAHAVLQAALTDNPKNNTARYTDGCVLARMGKNEEASQAFTSCADAASAKDPMRVRARHFAENPALSMAKMAPAFEVTALDGTHFNLDSMNGKVVLIDFWATWCGPCNEELPHVKKIVKEFAGQPLVVISISWDRDEDAWKKFVAKNEMTWLQYRDEDHSLSARFGVEAIPHYFTIDSDGVLTAEMLGSGNDVEGKLKKLLKRANEAKAAQTVASTN